MPMHSKKQAQIGALLFNKAFTKVLAEYSNYNNVFLIENVTKLLKNIEINKYVIKLEESKQPFFRSIYSLKPVELETLKTYIEINLVNGFIRLSKSLIRVFILFDKKPNKNLYFCIDIGVLIISPSKIDIHCL